MIRTSLGLVGLLAWVGVLHAAVVVELHDQPLVESVLQEREAALPTGDLLNGAEKSNRPTEGQWYIPHFRADKIRDGDSTYFSVRNESSLPTTVLAEFYDVKSNLSTTQSYQLDPREVRSVAVKHVPNLPIAGDGYARGFLRITSLAPVMVDHFQLETRNAFAVGGVGFVVDDFCTRWNARFLRFDASGGTTLSIMVNGPRGNRPFDPVTIAGDIYTEGGDFVSSFAIRTDEWSMEVAVHDLLPPGIDFGVVELVVNSFFSPAGIIEVQHQALGQFSVGHWATCMD